LARLRDDAMPLGELPVGPGNAITDVPGVRIGHTTLTAGDGSLIPGHGPVRTGVTAILPHPHNLYREKVSAAVYTINGFGKAVGFEQVRELGVLETPIVLTNTLNVGTVADAVISYMVQQNPDIGIATGTINPVVGECNDGYLNDIQGRHVHAEHVLAAIQEARTGPVPEGCLGAGTGTGCFGFKGGIGTASRWVADQYMVGALVQSNFGSRRHLRIDGVPVGRHFADRLLPEKVPGPGSIMMVIATDAPLTARQLGRLARRAPFGLARTGSTGSNGSGDFVIAFSTANQRPHYAADAGSAHYIADENHRMMNLLFLAVIESIEEAIINSLTTAQTTRGRDNHTLHALPYAETLALLQRHARLRSADDLPGEIV
jgi:D-aminopeptidase